MKITTKLIPAVASFIFLMLLNMSCKKSGKQPEANTEVLPENVVELREDQIKLADIRIAGIEKHSMGSILKVNGIISVAPRNLATVCMPYGGFIRNTSLLPGNSVAKGQVLAVIENQDFVDVQQSYLEARNKLAFTEADLKRHTDLYKEDVYSEQNIQQVTVEYRNLKGLVKSLEQKLILIGIDPAKLNEENLSSSVNLLSPISGYVKSVNINLGKYVNPAEIMFEIVNTDDLFLELTLFEKDADKALKGQKVKFYINNETEEHEALITQTGKSVMDDKSMIVYASVSSSCKNLLPGMYVNAFISESDNKVDAVPSEAVISFDDKDYIFVFERNKEEEGKAFTEYKMIEITKGISGAGFTEIKLPQELKADSLKVVTKGAYNLLSALKNAGEMAC